MKDFSTPLHRQYIMLSMQSQCPLLAAYKIPFCIKAKPHATQVEVRSIFILVGSVSIVHWQVRGKGDWSFGWICMYLILCPALFGKQFFYRRHKEGGLPFLNIGVPISPNHYTLQLHLYAAHIPTCDMIHLHGAMF